MSPAAIILGFLLSAAAVVLAGVRLARDGDAIAARTRLGAMWVGSVFLAFATSLPELTTDISAVRLGAPDLAAGDLFGSSMANMLILALVSLMPGAELFKRAALDNGLGAALAIALTATAALFILVHPVISVGGVGIGSIVLAVGYVLGIRAVFRSSAVTRAATEVEELTAGEPPPGTSVRGPVTGFLLASLVILVAAPFFATSAKGLAELTGLGTTFVGTWLVGFATSLPELVTSVTAVRMKAYDLAVANLFGSNAVNMVMFAPLDIANHGRPVLSVIEPVHAISAIVGVVLMAIGIAAIVYRSGRRWRKLEPSGALMMLVYVAGLGVVFLSSRK
jgi:cation:H+ antiporter